MATTAARALELITASNQRGRLAHAYLISGAVGSGKEALAARLIQEINPREDTGADLFGEEIAAPDESLDPLESGSVRIIRPQSLSRFITVKQIRDLEHSLQFSAAGGVTKFGILVDADRMNDQAANAFLKTLEEPPAATVLLLLTRAPERLLATIHSRCVRIPLTGGSSLLDGSGQDLVTELNAAASQGFGPATAALALKARFSSFLDAAKAATDAAAASAYKEEIASYRDTTDGTWLRDREDFHKAAARADYLMIRSRLLDVLVAWLTDLLRLRIGARHLSFPASSEALRPIAESHSPDSLLRRIDALERLRQSLETNTQETLALETSFLTAFG